MNRIDTIKHNYNIRDLAEQFGAKPNSAGKCKFNPIREERTSSLQIYDDTNTFHDFGSGLTGDVISFYSEFYKIDLSETIERMLSDIGKNKEYFEQPKVIEKPKKEYMSVEAVRKAFNSPLHKNITLKDHSDILLSIVPEYVILEAETDDKIEFFNILKVAKPDGKETAVVLLPSYKGVAYTMRYRYKQVGDETKKWVVALYDSNANYAYCRLNNNPITLIVEGTRDFLSALLCGYSVIAIPSAGFKNVDNEWLKDRICIFIDDDDGKNSMVGLYENAICEKIFFNHKKFKEITKCNSKDFSDYLYQFKDLKHFKDSFEYSISLMKDEIIEIDWKSKIFEISKPITKEDIENVENQEFLYPELIIKNNITVIVSPPNTGKSALVFGIAKQLLKEEKINDLLFLDPDSPISYVKKSISNMVDEFGEKVSYFNGIKTDKFQMMDMLLSLTLMKQKVNEHTLIILDGLQFLINGEISKDSNVKPFMETLQKVRDKFGATIILLHHTKRAKNENGDAEYLGTQIIETVTDNMIVANAKNNNLFLHILKSRADKKNNVYAIDIDFANKEIKNVRLKGKKDEIEAEQSEIPDEINVSDILDFMQDKKVGLKELKAKFGKNVSDILKEYLGRYWNKKQNENDKFSPIYWVINKSPTITEFETTLSDTDIMDIFGD